MLWTARMKQKHPYTVTEQNSPSNACSRGLGTATRFSSPIPAKSISYHYERHPADRARVNHATLEVDRTVTLKSVAIGYGRRKRSVGRSAWLRSRRYQT